VCLSSTVVVSSHHLYLTYSVCLPLADEAFHTHKAVNGHKQGERSRSLSVCPSVCLDKDGNWRVGRGSVGSKGRQAGGWMVDGSCHLCTQRKRPGCEVSRYECEHLGGQSPPLLSSPLSRTDTHTHTHTQADSHPSNHPPIARLFTGY